MRNRSFLLCVLLLASCASGSVAGNEEYRLGLQYLHGDGVPEDHAKAIEHLTRAGELGSPEADTTLGYLTLRGNGVLKDEVRGLQLFKRAALNGARDAQYNVGLAYAKGIGTKEDFSEAIKWFRKAALKGDVGSQYNLGVMELNGEGTVRNPIAAYVWFSLAADQGYEGAASGMQTAKNSLSSEQVQTLPDEIAKIASQIKVPESIQQTMKVQMQPL